MKNKKAFYNYSLFLTMGLLFSACSSENSSSKKTVDNTPVIKVPGDRSRVQSMQRESPLSLFSVDSETSGSDVEGLSLDHVGQDLIERINAAAQKVASGEISKEDIDSEISRYLNDLYNHDLDRLSVELENEATQERLVRDAQIVENMGGQKAVDQLETHVLTIDEHAQNTEKEIKALLASIFSYDETLTGIRMALSLSNRDDQIAAIKAEIANIDENVKDIRDTNVSERVALLNAQDRNIKTLKEQITVLDGKIARLNMIFDQRFKEKYQAAYDRNWANRGGILGIGFTGAKSEATVQAETTAEVTEEILAENPNLRASYELTRGLRAKRDALASELKILEETDVNSPELATNSKSIEELENEKTEKLALLAKYDRNGTKYFLYNETFHTRESLSRILVSNENGRRQSLERIQALDLRDDKGELYSLRGIKELSDRQAVLTETGTDAANVFAEILKKDHAAEYERYDSYRAQMNESSEAFQKSLDTKMEKLYTELAQKRDLHKENLQAIVDCLSKQNESTAQNGNRLSIATLQATDTHLTANLQYNNFFQSTGSEANEDGSRDIEWKDNGVFQRFVALIMNDDNEMVSFETISQSEESKLEKLGWGETGEVKIVEAEEEGAEDVQIKVRGEKSFEVSVHTANMTTPLRYLKVDNYNILVCAQTEESNESVNKRFYLRETPVETSPSIRYESEDILSEIEEVDVENLQ